MCWRWYPFLPEPLLDIIVTWWTMQSHSCLGHDFGSDCFRMCNCFRIYFWIYLWICFRMCYIHRVVVNTKTTSLASLTLNLFHTFFLLFFFLSRFSFTQTDDSQGSRGRGTILFHSTTSTHSRTSRYSFATMHVRWLSRIFNRTTCVYQTATRWDLPS